MCHYRGQSLRVIWTSQSSHLCWISQCVAKAYTLPLVWVREVGVGGERWRGNKGERKESANMGGCRFHWALPCAQATVWSCRWWISLCWLADEPWPRVIGLPFVCPLPSALAPTPLHYTHLFLPPAPPPASCCTVKISLTERGTPVSLWCSRAQRRGMMLMKLHSLMKSSCGMFWKTKAPTVRRLFSRFSTFPRHAGLEYCFSLEAECFFFCFFANGCFFTSMAQTNAFFHAINFVNGVLKGLACLKASMLKLVLSFWG